ncbi:MAG: cohesin domain-containing protein [bacterium]
MTYTDRVSPKQAMAFVAFLVVWLTSAGRIGHCQNLIINNQKGNQKESVMFTVSVKNAPNAMQSFGFEVHYDHQILEYTRYERGKAVEKYKFFDCLQAEPGVVRCGGFTGSAGKISAGQSGEIVNLYFRKINCRNTTLSLQNPVDDLKGWKAGDGRFTCRRD